MVTPSFKTSTAKSKADYAEFTLEPLEQGYGDTLGNSLRRIMLSSLEGAAITEVKINGVRHQYSTISGLKEDVVDLILNLKQVRLSYSGEKTETLKLSAVGPKQVTAKDIKGPASVKIVNPDLKLATLANKKSKLSFEIKVERGLGYSPAADRKSNTIGVIPVDASFSPVTRVAYSVEATRIGRRTDFDKLIIKIWTDGSLKPKVALENAAKILVDFARQVYKPSKVKKPASTTLDTPNRNGGVYDLTVEELELPTRIANALRQGGYKTVKHIIEANPADLAKVKNLGEKSTEKIRQALSKKDVTMKGE